MGKVKIYLSLRDGVFFYRDTEAHEGKTITTKVKKGDTITWKLDQCSGIKAITNINIKGSEDFFSKGPEKKDFDTWKAEVNKKGKGKIEYYIVVDSCIEEQKNHVGDEPKPPIIIIEED